MEFFKKTTQIDFMKQKNKAIYFSVIIAILSIISLATKGLNLGLDFTGGTQIEITSSQSINIDRLRNDVKSKGLDNLMIQSYGNSNHAIIRIGSSIKYKKSEIETILKQTNMPITISKIEYIGPQVGQDLLNNGLLAIFVSLIATMLYIAIRFEMKFAISAIVSLIHDPVLILGIFAYAGIEFNLISLAAILTILGYSLNDTIVVYDRVRENFRLFQKKTANEIINLSVNQTLSRTIMTSGVTLLVVISLYVLGGESLEGFALALIIGIVIGTYSSIYIAGSLAVTLGLNRQSLLPKAKTGGLQV